MNLCTKCCKLVPVDESEAHCAAHAAADLPEVIQPDELPLFRENAEKDI